MGRSSPSRSDRHTNQHCTPSQRAKSSGRSSPESRDRRTNTHCTPPRPAQRQRRQPTRGHLHAEAHQGGPNRKRRESRARHRLCRRKRAEETRPPILQRATLCELQDSVFRKITTQNAATVRSKDLGFSPGASGRRAEDSHNGAFKKGTTSTAAAAAAR